MLSPRVRAALRYLSWAGPMWDWRISKSECPLCGPTLFLSFKPWDFMTRCLSCKANAVTLSLIPVIKEKFPNPENCHAYELSSYGSTLEYLRRHFGKVTISEYIPDEERGATVNGVLNQDIQRLTFPDCTFDLITSNSVMEHVPDDIQGFRESLRVLKPGGVSIFSVPLYDTPRTIHASEMAEPEYHDSRLGGPRSAPVFWRHSVNDICDRLRAAGFKEASLADVLITPAQGSPTKVVLGISN